MPTNSYDPKEVIVTWAGIIFQGWMDGTVIQIATQEDITMLHVGTMGDATYVDNANKSAIATLTLGQGSITNDLLSAAFAAKLVGPFLLKDLKGTTLVACPDCKGKKYPDVSYGKEIEGRPWEFWLPKPTIVIGGLVTP